MVMELAENHSLWSIVGMKESYTSIFSVTSDKQFHIFNTISVVKGNKGTIRFGGQQPIADMLMPVLVNGSQPRPCPISSFSTPSKRLSLSNGADGRV